MQREVILDLLAIFIMTLRDAPCGCGGGIFINSNWRSSFFLFARMRDSSRQHAVNLHIGPKRETRFAFWGHPATKRSCRRRQAAQGGAGYVVFVIIQTEDREEFSETGKIPKIKQS